MVSQAAARPVGQAASAPIPRGGRLLLLGYWGFRNLGDDLMLRSALDYVGQVRPDLRLTVSARDARWVQLPSAVDCIAGVGVFPKLRRARALRQADGVAWLGGTCLYENHGLRGLHAYVLRTARMRKPFHFVNIGIGSFTTPTGRKMLQDVLEQCASASFRDPLSLACAKEIVPASAKFTAGGDLVSLVDFPKAGPRSRLEHVGFSGTREYADDVVTVHWLGTVLRDLVESGCKIHFFEFHGGTVDSGDHALHRKIISRLPQGSFVLENPDSSETLMSRLAEMDFHIGMRLHSVILSDMAGVPGLGLAVSSKIQRYLAKMESEARCVVTGSRMAPETLRQLQRDYHRPDRLLEQECRQALEGMATVFGEPGP